MIRCKLIDSPLTIKPKHKLTVKGKVKKTSYNHQDQYNGQAANTEYCTRRY